MRNHQLITVKDVPQAARQAIGEAARRTGASRNNILNWCLARLGDMCPNNWLYWISDADPTKAHFVPVEPLLGGDRQTISVKLTDASRYAMVLTRTRFDCHDGDAVAIAAKLAQYYGRHDGQLAFGRLVAGRRNTALLRIAH